MGDIVIIRHGITAENTQSLLRGWDQVPLTPEGIQVVEKSAQRLRGVPVQVIFTSDLLRATQSAQIVQYVTGAPVKKIPALRAWNVGKFTGQPRASHAKDLLYYEQHSSDPVPGGESFRDFVHRVALVAGFIMESQAPRSQGVVVMVLHNSVLTLVWQALHGKKLTVHEEKPGESQIVPPGGMVALTRGLQGWQAKTL